MTGKETTEEVCGQADSEQAKKEELRAAFLEGAEWFNYEQSGRTRFCAKEVEWVEEEARQRY